MAKGVILRDEPEFKRHVVGLIGGGCLAGGVTTLLDTFVGQPVAALGPLTFGAVMAAVINQLDPREDTAVVRLVTAAAGGILMAGLQAADPWGAPWLAAAVGGAVWGGALTFDRPDARPRRWATWGLFAAVLPAGFFAANTLVDLGFWGPLDVPIVRQAFAGSAWGLFLAVAAGASDLQWSVDAVASKLDRAHAASEQPVTGYLESASAVYRKIVRHCQRCRDDDTRGRALEIGAETVDSLIRFARRRIELGDISDHFADDRLAVRLEHIDQRLDQQLDDPTVAEHLEQICEQMAEQLRTRRHLERVAARVESGLQRGVTILERLHLTLVEHAAGAANDAGLTDSLGRLERLADEVEFKNLSIDQLCGAENGQSPPVLDLWGQAGKVDGTVKAASASHCCSRHAQQATTGPTDADGRDST